MVIGDWLICGAHYVPNFFLSFFWYVFFLEAGWKRWWLGKMKVTDGMDSVWLQRWGQFEGELGGTKGFW